jgi:hypothetical protein
MERKTETQPEPEMLDEHDTDKTSKSSFPYVDGIREKWYNTLEVLPRP